MAETKNVHSGHRKRMRERFMNGGFTNYQPHEVLEQLLFEAIPRSNTNVIAHLLLERFGSLDGVFRATKEELMTIHGIGEKSAELILSVYPKIGQYMLNQFKSADSITIYDIVLMIDWFIKQCRDERLYIMLLGDGGRFLDFIPIPHEMIRDPFAISKISDSYTDAVIIYLVAAKKEYVCVDFVEEVEKLMRLRGCILSDAFYLTENGFVSVTNPNDVLDIYKTKSQKSVGIKVRTKTRINF